MSGFRGTVPMNWFKSFNAVAIVGLAIGYAYSQVGTSQQIQPSSCPLHHQVFPSNCDGSMYAAWAEHSEDMEQRIVVGAGEMKKAGADPSPYGKWKVSTEHSETELGL